MLRDGQFRKVQYTDDGCYMWQCMWCKNMIEIRDDANYWNFCPKCGKSWFRRLRCRGHETPRWAWDRYGDNNPPGIRFYPKHKYPEWEWVVEERTKWRGQEWSEWKFERNYKVNHGQLGAWRDGLWLLNRCRTNVENDDIIRFEYRIRKRKI